MIIVLWVFVGWMLLNGLVLGLVTFSAWRRGEFRRTGRDEYMIADTSGHLG